MTVVFWICAGLLIYAQLGYGLVLALAARVLRPRVSVEDLPDPLPTVSVIVAAHDEAAVIGARVANLRALDYPRLEIIVASDGSGDATVQRARDAGADTVLDLPRGGKVAAQDAAAALARGTVLAFSDANAAWAADAVTELVRALAAPRVGYVCGDVRFSAAAGSDNQEGLYWRYEMFLRRQESALASITAGNGAIYAVRADAYVALGPAMSHDIAFPFSFVKRGLRAVYADAARATEKMAPSIDGEFARKRRMARRSWPAVTVGGMISPVGYGPLYALMIFSHRILRYLSPFLHVVAFAANVAALALGAGVLYGVTLAAQLALVAVAVAAPRLPGPLRRVGNIARYYVWTTASLGLGLIDWLGGANTVTWESVEGTR